MDDDLRFLVRSRAGLRCEYCLLPELVLPEPHEVEHIISRQHDGPTVPSNLALSCWHCNRHKGPNLAGIDWKTSATRLVPLYNPRRHTWAVHFRFEDAHIAGKTAIGRVTVRILNMNNSERLDLRACLLEEGMHFE